MGKVFVFGMLGVIIIGLLAGGIVLIGGSAKLTSLFWRDKRNNEERSEEKHQGPHGPAGGGTGSGWV